VLELTRVHIEIRLAQPVNARAVEPHLTRRVDRALPGD
jgi:hypothetical protein